MKIEIEDNMDYEVEMARAQSGAIVHVGVYGVHGQECPVRSEGGWRKSCNCGLSDIVSGVSRRLDLIAKDYHSQ